MNTTTSTLEKIVQPLADQLQATYEGREEFHIPPFCPFREIGENEVLIELPDDIRPHTNAWRAVLTLLVRTGSETVWSSGEPDLENPLGFPLRFSLIKQAAWNGDFWKWARYLVVDQGGADLDLEAAIVQISVLEDLLKDHSNLVEVGADELGLF